MSVDNFLDSNYIYSSEVFSLSYHSVMIIKDIDIPYFLVIIITPETDRLLIHKHTVVFEKGSRVCGLTRLSKTCTLFDLDSGEGKVTPILCPNGDVTQFCGHFLRSATFLGLFFQSNSGHFCILGLLVEKIFGVFRSIW